MHISFNVAKKRKVDKIGLLLGKSTSCLVFKTTVLACCHCPSSSVQQRRAHKLFMPFCLHDPIVPSDCDMTFAQRKVEHTHNLVGACRPCPSKSTGDALKAGTHPGDPGHAFHYDSICPDEEKP